MLFNPDEREHEFERVLNDDFISEVFFKCEVSSISQLDTLKIALILLWREWQDSCSELLLIELNGSPSHHSIYKFPEWMMKHNFTIQHSPDEELPFHIRFGAHWGKGKTLDEALELARNDLPQFQ